MSKTVSNFNKTLVASGLLALTSVASAEFSGNVALTTDYVWRGYSQTNEEPAIQGGFDFAAKSGVYFGTWGSNVDFGTSAAPGKEQLELDLYGGWAGEFGGFGLDVGAIRYNYFEDNGSDFSEAYVGGSWKWFSVQANIQVQGADIGDYFQAGFEFPLPQDIALALHVGKYDYDAGVDPSDYSVGVSKEFGGFGFDVTYYDTNSDGASRYGNLGDSRVVLTVSKSM